MTMTRAVSDRERLLAMLANQPPVSADVVVVLCGEDAIPRLEVGREIFARGLAPTILVTGGRHSPPRWMGATAAYSWLIGQGVAPSRIIVDDTTSNTYEQAVALAGLATERTWSRVILVASGYHLPRAFLTMLKALQERELDSTVRLIPVATSHASWLDCPEGMKLTRLSLLDVDLAKIDAYGDHVASPADGVSYLSRWDVR